MERHQALIVSHRDGQPHVHVIANRVGPESGKAAGLSRSKLKLSKWAERYEREQGKIRCPERERNNRRREARERVVDGCGHSGGTGAGTSGLAVGGGAHAWRGKELGELERRSKRSWSELYGRQERQREQLAKDCHGVLGRLRAWRELGGKLREIGGTSSVWACTDTIVALATRTEGVSLLNAPTASLNATITCGRSSAPLCDREVFREAGFQSSSVGVLDGSRRPLLVLAQLCAARRVLEHELERLSAVLDAVVLDRHPYLLRRVVGCEGQRAARGCVVAACCRHCVGRPVVDTVTADLSARASLASSYPQAI